MNDGADTRQIQELMDEFGLTAEDAAFAVRLASGQTKGDLIQHSWPLREDVTRRWTSSLVEQHGFTSEEAARYLQGDRSAIDSARARAEIGQGQPSADAAAGRQLALLVDYLGFTPDEAARYVAGDRSAIEAVAARRLAADERDLATADSLSRSSALGAS